MESSKFKSRLFVAFGQVTALHQRAQSALARLRRSIAETLQRVRGALRSAENTPRKLRAISRDAIVVMNHDISKFRSRFSIVLELMATHLRRAQGAPARPRGGVADRPQRLRRAVRLAENELCSLVGSCCDTIVAMNHRIRKFGSQLSNGFEQRKGHVRQAQRALARLGRSVAGRLQRQREAPHSAKNESGKAVGISRDAIAVTNHNLRKFRSQFSIVLEPMATHLRRAQGTLTRLRGGVADRLRRLRWVLRSAENELRKKVVGSCRDAIAAMNHRIRTFRWQLSNGFDQGTAHLRRAQSSLIRLVKKVIEKPTRVRQELRLRENELRELLTSSLDAIVVTNDSRRFVAANPKALELFGVSEKNLVKFSIDVFLSGPILDFGRSGSSRISREEKHGKCEIRRLDGSLRVADCVFVPNFVPFQHLCRFCDITRQNRRVQIGRKTLAGPRQYASTQLR